MVSKISFSTALFLISVLAFQQIKAQDSKLVFLEIRKGVNDAGAEVFDPLGIRLGVLLVEDQRVTGVGANSEITHFSDNHGTDMLAAHQQSVNRYQQLESVKANGNLSRSQAVIDFQRTDYMPEGVGVLLHLWTLPTPGTTKLHVKGSIEYSIIESDSVYSEVQSGYSGIFSMLTELEWKGAVIKFSKQAYGKGEEAYISLRGELTNPEMQVALGEVELLDHQGQVLEKLQFYYNNTTSFETRNKFDLEAVTDIRFNYKVLSKKTVVLDQEFGMGL